MKRKSFFSLSEEKMLNTNYFSQYFLLVINCLDVFKEGLAGLEMFERFIFMSKCNP